MPDFGVTFARSARKELESLPVDVADRILLRIEKLTRHPRPRGAIKLQGKLKLWQNLLINLENLFHVKVSKLWKILHNLK